MFARLFGPDDDQIMVMLHEWEGGKPEVRVHFQPEGYGVCSFGSIFEDTDDGWDKAQHMLRTVTEEQLREIVRKTIEEFTE